MRYDDDMSKTMTSREVFEFRLGRSVTDDELLAMTPKRDRKNALNDTGMLYKLCDICQQPFCVNNWDDRKPRTPKYKGFIVCHMCDPRPIPDRFMKEGYRIVYPGRLRVIRLAQVTRALARRGCIVPDWHKNYGDENCKCAGCAAVKLMGEP